MSVLLDAVQDASRHTQVLLTSHSPDLLDRDDMGDDTLLAVAADDGITTVGSINTLGREALRDRLFTAGELLRLNQLDPDDDARRTSRSDQMKLFS